MPPSSPPQPSHRPQDYALATVGWLMFPALLGCVFTRRRFGLRAVGSPGRYVLGTLLFVAVHYIGGMEAHWHNPPFLESFAWRYFEVFYLVALVHVFDAWRAFRRCEGRHTQSMGEPWLMLLGVPYRLACLLDAGLIILIGAYGRRYDVALGAWLMWGGGGLALLALMGAQKQFNDTADLLDAGLYVDRIHDRVDRPDVPHGLSGMSPAADAEEVSTAAQGKTVHAGNSPPRARPIPPDDTEEVLTGGRGHAR